MAKKTYKEINGQTRVGKLLREIGRSDILEKAVNIVGEVATGNYLGAIKTLISSDKDLTPESKELALKEIEKDIALEQEITKRWEADMSSDSWLSKNIRPIGLAWVLIMTTVLMIISWIGLATPEQVLYMFSGIATTVVGGYYVLRTVEKRNEKKYK